MECSNWHKYPVIISTVSQDRLTVGTVDGSPVICHNLNIFKSGAECARFLFLDEVQQLLFAKAELGVLALFLLSILIHIP